MCGRTLVLMTPRSAVNYRHGTYFVVAFLKVLLLGLSNSNVELRWFCSECSSLRLGSSRPSQRRRPEDEIEARGLWGEGGYGVGARGAWGQGWGRGLRGAGLRPGQWEKRCWAVSQAAWWPLWIGRLQAGTQPTDPLTSALGLLNSWAERRFAFVVICCSSNRKLMHCICSSPPNLWKVTLLYWPFVCPKF